MTTDELERGLKTLAEPRADDEFLRRAIRAQLQSRPGARRHNPLVFGFAAVAAAALAATIIALIGTGGPSSANAAILAHVVRASRPPADLIVHVKEIGAQRDGTQVGAEWWQETNPPYAVRLIKGPVGAEVESADPRSPTLIDPIETMRAGLTDGTAQIAGTVTIDGRSLYKIELPDGVVGYFDRGDYRPVYIDNPQRDGSVVRTQVVAYEELPITPENEKLLTIAAQRPAASVDTRQK
jgi:hypothetical protein